MWRLCLCILSCVAITHTYKILVVFPLPGKSHGILGDGYVRHLLNAGHEVTYITPFPKKDPQPKLRIIDVGTGEDVSTSGIMNLERIINKETDFGDKVFPMMLGFANHTLSHPNVQALMMDPKETFDLVIGEWMFSEAYCGFAPIFNAHYVIATPMEPNWMMLQLIDDLPNPSYTVDILSLEFTPFSFFQRAKQLFIRLVGLHMKNVNVLSQDEELYTKYYTAAAKARGVKLPPFSETRFNATLMLSNSHVSLSEASSLPQSCKYIGGYHIDTKFKPLPEKLQKIMDNSKEGVIYFSMGSNLRSESLPAVIKTDLLKLFGKLKQTVLWKFEDDTLKDIPKNVHILKWAPQPSILDHPKTRLFITHGGLLSTIEAIHFGVPIIGLPVFGDQFINVGRSASRGFALKVDWSYDAVKDLEKAVKEILENPKYTNRVKELSFVYHDRVVPPGAELAHWARHVIETNGAPLLKSPALSLAWYQRYYADLAVTMLILVIALYCLVKKVLKKVCGKQKVKTN